MIIDLDLRKEKKGSKKVEYLRAILSLLIGQTLHKIEMSYGGELVLHLGEPVPCTSRKLARGTKGSWILGTRASRWRLHLNEPPNLILSNGSPTEKAPEAIESILADDEEQVITPEDVERKAERLVGTTVVTVTAFPAPVPIFVSGIELIIELSDKTRVFVMPSPEPDDEPKLADWELFTPYHTFLACGPGLVWSYLHSDVLE